MTGELLGYAHLNTDTNVVLGAGEYPLTALYDTLDEAEAVFDLEAPKWSHLSLVEVRSLEQ